MGVAAPIVQSVAATSALRTVLTPDEGGYPVFELNVPAWPFGDALGCEVGDLLVRVHA
ncbi:MAG: hypothetical protein QM607_13155 [Microbacterium sp.]